MADNEILVQLAEEIARETGAFLRKSFIARSYQVNTKTTPTDPVSEVDIAAEALIRERLTAARPDDAILGEEAGSQAGSSNFKWVIDPLDGTVNFIYGIPQWAVSIACEDQNANALVGVIYDPMSEELWSAQSDGPALLNGSEIEASNQTDLATSLIATGFGYASDVRALQAKAIEQLLPSVRDIRRFGSAALDLAWTAAGRYDAYFEHDVERWDVAAGALLCLRAGLEIRRLPPSPPAGAGILAAPAPLVEQLLAFVSF